ARLDKEDAERAALEKRVHELITAHAKDWLPPEVTALRAQTEFHRGFVEKLAVDAQTFLRNAETLFQAAPLVRRLDLNKSGRFVRDLAALPPLPRLVALDPGHGGLDDAAAVALADSPHLAGLVDLDLRGNRIGAAGAAALVSSPYLTRLGELQLNAN